MKADIIVLSDLHLGSSYSNPDKLLKFLKKIKTDLLILNGDIIDGWALRRNRTLTTDEVKVLKEIQKISKNTKVIYTRGNHDDFLDHAIPLTIGGIEIRKEYVLSVAGKKYLVIHGDLFDKITKEIKWIAKAGDIGYSFIIKLNRFLNKMRARFGMSYYSLSAQIKNGVKKAVNYISEFEVSLVMYAKQRNFDGIICGHIHNPSINKIEDIEYLNSGDWVESMSSLVYKDDEWKIIYH